MNSMYDEIMHGMQEILEHEQGKKTLRVDRICVVPLADFSADEIKKIRRNVSLSQRSFASVIGVSAKTVEAWEAGINKPNGSSARLLQIIKDRPEMARLFYSCPVPASK